MPQSLQRRRGAFQRSTAFAVPHHPGQVALARQRPVANPDHRHMGGQAGRGRQAGNEARCLPGTPGIRSVVARSTHARDFGRVLRHA